MTFKEEVYVVVRKIPKGKVLTYKEVAKRAGKQKAYRAVGNILNKNTDLKVPCHRVIRSDGKIGGYRYGNRAKIKILVSERADLAIRPPRHGRLLMYTSYLQSTTQRLDCQEKSPSIASFTIIPSALPFNSFIIIPIS